MKLNKNEYLKFSNIIFSPSINQNCLGFPQKLYLAIYCRIFISLVQHMKVMVFITASSQQSKVIRLFCLVLNYFQKILYKNLSGYIQMRKFFPLIYITSPKDFVCWQSNCAINKKFVRIFESTYICQNSIQILSLLPELQ